MTSTSSSDKIRMKTTSYAIAPPLPSSLSAPNSTLISPPSSEVTLPAPHHADNSHAPFATWPTGIPTARAFGRAYGGIRSSTASGGAEAKHGPTLSSTDACALKKDFTEVGRCFCYATSEINNARAPTHAHDSPPHSGSPKHLPRVHHVLPYDTQAHQANPIPANV